LFYYSSLFNFYRESGGGEIKNTIWSHLIGPTESLLHISIWQSIKTLDPVCLHEADEINIRNTC